MSPAATLTHAPNGGASISAWQHPAVGTGVHVTVRVGVAVGVGVLVDVRVGVMVAVFVDVAVSVGVSVGVAVGARTVILAPVGLHCSAPSSTSQPPGGSDTGQPLGLKSRMAVPPAR